MKITDNTKYNLYNQKQPAFKAIHMKDSVIVQQQIDKYASKDLKYTAKDLFRYSPKLEEIAKKYEVLVKQKCKTHPILIIPMGLLAAVGTISAYSSGVSLLAGITAVSAVALYKWCEEKDGFTVQIGEKAVKNIFGQTKLHGAKTEPILIESLNEIHALDYMVSAAISTEKIKSIIEERKQQKEAQKYLIFEKLNKLFGDIKPKEKNRIINEIKKDKNIDYNLKDENGITPLEIILNSENKELLELLSDKELLYYPELDFVYEGITNPGFKSEARKLNLRFRDIEEAIRLESKEAMEKLEPQFKSPFFKNAATKIADSALDIKDNKFKSYFFAKHMKFLPEYMETQLLFYNQ